jgi:hypothetical protein
MVSAGTNIMLHYFGDPSTGNLATATAMELPMLKSFTSYQELWKSAFGDIFRLILGEDLDSIEDQSTIDIDLPPILAEDITRLGQFVTALTTAFPEAKVDAVLKALLVALKVNNIDEIMNDVEENRKKIDANQELQNQVMLAKAKMTPEQAQAQQATDKKLAEAMVMLAEAIRA